MSENALPTFERIAITPDDVINKTIEQYIESLVASQQSNKPNVAATVIDCSKLYENGSICFDEQLRNLALHKVLKQSVKNCGPQALSVREERVWLRNYRHPSEIRTTNFATDQARCQLLQKHEDIYEGRREKDAGTLIREVEDALFKVTDGAKFKHSAYHANNLEGSFFNQTHGNDWNLHRLSSDSKVALEVNESTLAIDEPGSLIPIHDGDVAYVVMNYGPDIKLWTLVHPSDRDILRFVINKTLSKYTRSRFCRTAYRHKNMYVSTKSLKKRGVRYVQLVQQPREMMLVYPKVLCQGINCGMNVSESVEVLFSSSLVQTYRDVLTEHEIPVPKPCLKCRKRSDRFLADVKDHAEKRGIVLSKENSNLEIGDSISVMPDVELLDKPMEIEVKNEPLEVTDVTQDEGVILEDDKNRDAKLIELEERIRSYVVNRPNWRALSSKIEALPLNHFRWLSYWCCNHFKPVGAMRKEDPTAEDLSQADEFVKNLLREMALCRTMLGCDEIDEVLAILANHSNWKYKGEVLSYC